MNKVGFVFLVCIFFFNSNSSILPGYLKKKNLLLWDCMYSPLKESCTTEYPDKFNSSEIQS